MRVTVFTPTYNRGYIISNLYDSLRRQTFYDFEWVVIDDGSSDNTEELFMLWVSQPNVFDIIYQKVPNGGKHRAINRGVQLARGELFFIVDSDDYLTDGSLQTIVEIESGIPRALSDGYAGVCGKRGYSDNRDLGTSFAGDYIDITTLQRDSYGITGDKAEVFYTDILRKYPFPEYVGEKFVTECVVWDRIAHDGYKLRFFNKVVYICDYLPDGLTAHYSEMLKGSPKAWGLFIAQSIEFGKIAGLSVANECFTYYAANRERLRPDEIAANLQITTCKLRKLVFKRYLHMIIDAFRHRLINLLTLHRLTTHS